MSKDVIIIGAGGHAKVIADIVLCSGDNLVGFLDDNESKQGEVVYKDYKVIGAVSDYGAYRDKWFLIAIGDNHTRAKVADACGELNWYTAIHPKAVVADTTSVGDGTVVMAGVVVNADSAIGKHCILNTACSVDHDNKIGDYVHISPGVHLAGTVSVGGFSWICAGAVVSNNTNVVNDVIVGANATVLKDISESGVYIGTPAKKAH